MFKLEFVQIFMFNNRRSCASSSGPPLNLFFKNLFKLEFVQSFMFNNRRSKFFVQEIVCKLIGATQTTCVFLSSFSILLIAVIIVFCLLVIIVFISFPIGKSAFLFCTEKILPNHGDHQIHRCQHSKFAQKRVV